MRTLIGCLLVTAACSSVSPGDVPPPDSCVAGQVVACVCRDAGMGTQQCNASGAGYTACDCGASDAEVDDSAVTCTPRASVAPPPAFQTVTASQSCTNADIQAFVTACFGSSGTASTCNGWQSSANPTCVGCLIPPAAVDGGVHPSTGGVLWSPSGDDAIANQPGCLAIVDQSPACAAPLEAKYQCEDEACSGAACAADTSGDCQSAADMGACASEATASNAACAADFADGGDALSGTCSTLAGIFATICDPGNL